MMKRSWMEDRTVHKIDIVVLIVVAVDDNIAVVVAELEQLSDSLDEYQAAVKAAVADRNVQRAESEKRREEKRDEFAKQQRETQREKQRSAATKYLETRGATFEVAVSASTTPAKFGSAPEKSVWKQAPQKATKVEDTEVAPATETATAAVVEETTSNTEGASGTTEQSKPRGKGRQESTRKIRADKPVKADDDWTTTSSNKRSDGGSRRGAPKQKPAPVKTA